MKTIVFAAVLLFSVAAWAQVNPKDYPLTVHVTRSWLILEGSGNNAIGLQRLDVLIDGKKLELQAGYIYGLIPLGNYRGKLKKNVEKHGHLRQQTYEILFPDHSTESFLVVGESE